MLLSSSAVRALELSDAAGVELGEPDGSLDKDIVRRIVRAHINEVRYCYDEGLERDRDLEGTVVIRFTIASSGTVPQALVHASTLSDEDVEACIAGAVKRWTFPSPDGGEVIVTYPFVLEGG